MDACKIRRRADLEGLRALERRMPTLMEIRGYAGRPINRFDLVFRIKTPVDRRFPKRRREVCRVSLDIPCRYPFEPAQIEVVDQIYNPHVFPSGLLCAGWRQETNWTLAELTIRAMRIIALDPSIIASGHAANWDAANWYEKIRWSGIFPTAYIPIDESLTHGEISFRAIV